MIMSCAKNVSTNIQIIMDEHFAGSCSTACDNNPNINDSLRAVCDTGSQQYCVTASNIFTPNCKAYLTRVTGNATADKLAQVYTNPIKFITVAGKITPTAKDYYTDLLNVIAQQTASATNLISNDTADIINILKDNNPQYAMDSAYQTIVNNALNYCALNPTTPDTTFCSESASTPSWGPTEITKLLMTVLKHQQELVGALSCVKYYSKLNNTSAQTANDLATAQILHTRMPNTMKPIDDWILSTLTVTDLLDLNLVVLRQVSPYLRTGVDTFIINLVNGAKSSFTHERLNTNPDMYTINLSNTSALYDINFRTFVANLQAYNTANKIITDPLMTLIQMTDNANITTCITGNPADNPICTQVAATSVANATTILNAQVAYCSDNVSSATCIANINNNQKVYNMNDINTKMLNYCLSTSGQNDTDNCKTFSTINGSAQWLANATQNTTDAAGVTTSVCGTPGNLTKDTCQNVCVAYPDLCVTDIQKKCAISTNRYSTNIDFFQGGQAESMANPDDYEWFLIILLIVIVLFGGYWGIKAIRRSYRVYRCNKNNNPYSAYCDRNIFE
jgi:hypothetical protein